MWRRTFFRKPFLIFIFLSILRQTVQLWIYLSLYSQPCNYHIYYPNPKQPPLPAELPVLYSYVTTPTSAPSGYTEASGSHAVIDFCDSRPTISDTTAHIHYENMDKHIKTVTEHCHIIWNSGCTSVKHLLVRQKRQRGKLATSLLNKGETWLIHAIKPFIKVTLWHYIPSQSVILCFAT